MDAKGKRRNIGIKGPTAAGSASVAPMLSHLELPGRAQAHHGCQPLSALPREFRGFYKGLVYVVLQKTAILLNVDPRIKYHQLS